jgi:hypothetical protein
MIKHKGYKELLEWVAEQGVSFDLYITLTFRQRVTLEEADEAIGKLCNMIDRDVYGNACWRKGKRVKRLCFKQVGKTGTNTHMHFIAQTPSNYTQEEFLNLMEELWLTKIKTSGVKEQNKFEVIKNKKANNKYLLHEFYKLGNDTISTTSSQL